ncbi:MAG: enoyl-CoA hydratase/isomerase family protein [Dehalococcoidia bacterium]
MPVKYEVDGRIVTITIDRPEALNSINPETNQALADAFATFRDDPEVWIAILTGAGDRAFCTGADLKELIPALGEQARAGTLTEFNFGGITRGYDCWKPIIAAINGFALAGGTELVLACDIRIASDQARFGQPEVRWAIIPGAGGTQRLPRAIGMSAALEIILTGRQVGAEEALRLGLVHRVVPHGEVMAEARKTAAALLANGPLSLRAAKQAVMQGWDMPLEDGLALELKLFGALLHTDDASEGPKAFAEKRPPEYEAR